MRSLIMSNVYLGTTFFATSSPFTLYGRLLTIRSATSLGSPSSNTISLDEARLTLVIPPGAAIPSGGLAAEGAWGATAPGAGVGGMVGASVPPVERDWSFNSFW